jgi:hypothetical protein
VPPLLHMPWSGVESACGAMGCGGPCAVQPVLQWRERLKATSHFPLSTFLIPFSIRPAVPQQASSMSLP